MCMNRLHLFGLLWGAGVHLSIPPRWIFGLVPNFPYFATAAMDLGLGLLPSSSCVCFLECKELWNSAPYKQNSHLLVRANVWKLSHTWRSAGTLGLGRRPCGGCSHRHSAVSLGTGSGPRKLELWVLRWLSPGLQLTKTSLNPGADMWEYRLLMFSATWWKDGLTKHTHVQWLLGEWHLHVAIIQGGPGWKWCLKWHLKGE